MAVAPTPAGQAMAGPVFSLHLAGLTALLFRLSHFTGPVITAFASSRMARPNFYEGAYRLQLIEPCALKRDLAM